MTDSELLAKLRRISECLQLMGNILVFDYTNHRGERSRRLVEPRLLWHGSTAYHCRPGWMMDASDLERKVGRTFAVEMMEFLETTR